MDESQSNRFLQGIAAGMTDPKDLAEWSRVSVDEAKQFYQQNRGHIDNLIKTVAKIKTNKAKCPSLINHGKNIKTRILFSDKNPFARYKDKAKTILTDKQLPEYHGLEMMRNGETSIGNLVKCCLRFEPDKTKALNALDIVCIPWLSSNNWRTMALPTINQAGETTLCLQDSIPYDLMGAILVAKKEINRLEEKKSLEPTTATPAIRPPQRYPISPECPYRDKNQTCAAVWQILKDNRDGISPERLKKTAIEITGEAPDKIDEAVSVVTSRRNPDGQGRDPRALPGYWVERSECGKLIIRFPHLPGKWTDAGEWIGPGNNDNPKMTSRNPTAM